MKTALLYLLLVGVPLVGVAAILYVGAGLQAPRAVSGVWVPALTPDTTSSCLAAAGDDDPVLLVSQSGPRVAVRVEGVGAEMIELNGHLADDRLQARSRPIPLPGCSHPGALLLDARLVMDEGTRRLDGVFSGEGCACGAVSFVAARVEAEE